MKPTVYIKTSVVSYLTEWPSPQLVMAVQQQATREWWELDLSDAATLVAQSLIDDIPLHTNAEIDALHIAISAMNRVDLLLTWNCRHISNLKFRYRIEETCRHHGFEPPVICSPFELLQEPA